LWKVTRDNESKGERDTIRQEVREYSNEWQVTELEEIDRRAIIPDKRDWESGRTRVLSKKCLESPLPGSLRATVADLQVVQLSFEGLDGAMSDLEIFVETITFGDEL
jgi:hypothetical protein